MSNHDEHTHHLMMAALDGELAADERAELERRLAADADLAAEWKRLENLKEVTQMTKISTPHEEHWGSYWQGVYNRIERGIGWILFSLGATVLTVFGLWEAVDALFQDSSMPVFLKLSVFALGAGGAVLLISVIREKLFTHRHDPYKEVER